MNLKVNEIFYSLQGEGGRQGEASIFIRLTQCNLRCSFCDTDFAEEKNMSLEEIKEAIQDFPCRWIIWTGGEPCLQLNDAILSFFQTEGYLQAIESNGHFPLSSLLDYTVISPKGCDLSYAKKHNATADEIRIPLKKGDTLPSIEALPSAKFYFLSPIFSKNEEETQENINYCVQQIKLHPQWRLSLQIHKLIGIE